MLASALVAAITVVALSLLTPWPRGFTAGITGNAALAGQVAEAVKPSWRHHAAIARITPGRSPEFAGFGADEHTQFEIGSLTKTFTAALFADALARGEVKKDEKLEAVFPELAGTDAGALTLEQLAEQQTGLPRTLDGAGLAALPRTLLTLDPYTGDLPAVLAKTRGASTQPGTYAYSNHGIALLGQAVAKRANRDYSTLVHERLLTPLGMKETSVPTRASDLPADAPHGYAAGGAPAGPWTLHALAPAGSMRSTAHDMAIWLSAVQSGRAAGSEAKVPRAAAGAKNRIGYAWMTTGDITWHNGQTGGFSSWGGFDANGAGLVVLNDTAASVDGARQVLQTGASS